MATPMIQLNFRITPALNAALEAEAAATGQKKTEIVAAALEAYFKAKEGK